MSRKYFDKLLEGNNITTTKKVSSKFGEMMLKKMGWSEGKGLGKNEDGMAECLQVSKKKDNAGLGAQEEAKKKDFKWNNAFWVDVFDSVAKNLKRVENVITESAEQSTGDERSYESETEITSSEDETRSIITKKIQEKLKKKDQKLKKDIEKKKKKRQN